ncbi:MAG TPA: BadF/BadG/BcrA/BcrD ATPase family protein [bacterium]|nr:BadF/BadG/BcrA/BcrD ATPase family protein [bacterium]HPN33805.1 BadF/BadG/BcrA/BcrD ATPase family protein [bacterium]
MIRTVIGLDGGGTKTVGVLVDGQGHVLARAVAESSNFQVVGGEILSRVISDLVNQLLMKAGQSQPVAHLYAGLAGAGRPADRQTILAALEAKKLAEKITVDTDASVALAGAFAGGPGIIVISGTGAICFGKDSRGVWYRCGGWGYLLGDEGSGYYIGQQALIAALKDWDGRGLKTSLRPAIENKYGIDSIDLLISSIYSGKIDRTEIASLAPLVFAKRAEGDEAAQNIIASAGHEIGKIIAAVAQRMGLAGHSVRVALIGSVFKQRDILIPLMEKEACRVVQEIDFMDPQFEPAIGSAILALQQEQGLLDETVLAHLAETK